MRPPPVPRVRQVPPARGTMLSRPHTRRLLPATFSLLVKLTGNLFPSPTPQAHRIPLGLPPVPLLRQMTWPPTRRARFGKFM